MACLLKTAPFLVIAFLYSAIVKGELSEPVEATFTCDSRLWLFVDGRSVKFTKSWRQPVTYTFPAGSRLVAVQCRANRQTGTAGILGSFRNGLVTDGRWKCTRLDKYKINWKQIDYDDHAWPTAVEFFSNKEETPIYKKIGGISEHASWIWTADKAVGIVVGCRRILSDLVPRKQEKGIYVAGLENVNFAMNNYIAEIAKVADVNQCAHECRKRSYCRSFNFQHGGTVQPKKVCELTRRSRFQAPHFYNKRPGYTYYDDVSE